MRNWALACGVAAALFVVSAAGQASAARHNFLPEASRAVQGDRGLQVVVAQGEIKSDINPSNISTYTGGGLLGALIDVKVSSDRAKKAEKEIQPLRAALTGYDVDALAMQTTQAVVGRIDWFHPGAATFSRDSSVAGKLAALDAGAGSQVGFFEYTYDASPDFSLIRVAVSIQLANKAVPAGKRPESRLNSGSLAYAQTVTCVVALPSPSKDHAENAARWSADDGKLARRALAAAFDEIGVLAPRALQLQEADLKAMGSKPHKAGVAGGMTGWIQEEGPSGTLLYTGGLIHEQTIAE
jgi:hypothetical protein